MNFLQKAAAKEIYTNLPDNIYYLLLYLNWVDFDKRKTGNIETWNETFNARMFIIPDLEWFNIPQKNPELVKESNFLSTWFKCNNMLDLEAVKKMKHTNYKWIKRYQYYTLKEIV